MTFHRARRSVAVRLLRSIGRGLRIFMLAFAGLGPAPLPLPPPDPDPTAQVQERRPRAVRRR
jgi:hypothetical protein